MRGGTARCRGGKCRPGGNGRAPSRGERGTGAVPGRKRFATAGPDAGLERGVRGLFSALGSQPA